MKKAILIILWIACMVNAQDLNDLKLKIEKEFSQTKGQFALAFGIVGEPQNNIFINENSVFHAASTMKTPVMIEVFKQAEEGKFNIDDSIVVKNEFKSIVDGSLYSMDIDRDGGDEIYEYLGKKRTIRQLVHSMITVSSNLATNILIDLVGAENVTKTMRTLGAANLNVLRGVEDMKAYNLGKNNNLTASDLYTVFMAIAEGRTISQKASEEMIDILLDQKFKDKIPGKLPREVKVAHKTGSITGVQHDSGIVYLPDGRKYVLVILSRELEDAEKGVETIATASKMIYDYMIME